MAVKIEHNRLLIPGWVGYKHTALIGELTPSMPTEYPQIPITYINELYEDWKFHKSLAYAGDFISLIMSNHVDVSDKVIEVAQFIKKTAPKEQKILLETADLILGSANETVDNFQESSQHVLFAKQKQNYIIDIYSEIHNNRLKLREFPYNAILYVEQARLYTILGQVERADENINYALYLASNNRFVLRSAVRFFLHTNRADRAYYILRHRSNLDDPWLLAPEISVTRILDKHQVSAAKAHKLVESKSYSPHTITELSSSLASLELYNGGLKKSRKLFDLSLIDPTDNTMSQAIWANKDGLNILIPETSTDFYEASARKALSNNQYLDSLEFTDKWSKSMQFSRRPIDFAFEVSLHKLMDYDLSERIIERGLECNKDAGLHNNLAYVYALQNKCEQARIEIDKATEVFESMEMRSSYKDEDSKKTTEICIKATKGLIAFRNNDVELGNYYYLEAIEQSKKIKNKLLNWNALLNYARELLMANLADKEIVEKMIKPINRSETDTIEFLYNQIEKLLRTSKV